MAQHPMISLHSSPADLNPAQEDRDRIYLEKNSSNGGLLLVLDRVDDYHVLMAALGGQVMELHEVVPAKAILHPLPPGRGSVE